MQEIYKDGTTQEVFFDAVSADPELGAFKGSTNEQALTGATVALREYKKPTVAVSNPIITWENTLKKWKLNIPSSYITQYGHVLITIQHSSMQMVTIDCNTVDSDMYVEWSCEWGKRTRYIRRRNDPVYCDTYGNSREL